MADVTGITAVRVTQQTLTEVVKYGATVAVGNVLYLDPADNEYKLADNNDGELKSKASAMALTPGVDGGYGVIASRGSVLLIGATLTQGEPYIISATAGAIRPDSDSKTTGEYLTGVGRAASTTQLDLLFNVSGIQAP